MGRLIDRLSQKTPAVPSCSLVATVTRHSLATASANWLACPCQSELFQKDCQNNLFKAGLILSANARRFDHLQDKFPTNRKKKSILLLD